MFQHVLVHSLVYVSHEIVHSSFASGGTHAIARESGFNEGPSAEAHPQDARYVEGGPGLLEFGVEAGQGHGPALAALSGSSANGVVQEPLQCDTRFQQNWLG